MPLKTIGKGMSQQSSTGFGIDTDYTVATSLKFREIMAFSFDINDTQVLVTGLPRNDMLFEKGLGLNKFRLDESYSKVIIWMPTYRKSVIGDLRSDGNADGFGLKEMLFDNFDELNEMLKALNYLLIIKPHPMDELGKRNLPSSKNILPINDQVLSEYNIPLYYLLADSDVLITDYSSVYIDYLLTGNPIAFVCGDLNEYKNTRGFFFDNIQDYLPGEILETKEAFINYIKNLDEVNSKWHDKYLRVRNEFVANVDNKACERFCNYIWK
jgi:CDP-glycerol glycerophosphotransferase (TagB/SpsB family)